MPGQVYNRMAVVGFGLIGSSLARIAREKGVVGEIIAVDASG
jgi:cyclohexadieny/prephenate dehydrogenase